MTVFRTKTIEVNSNTVVWNEPAVFDVKIYADPTGLLVPCFVKVSPPSPPRAPMRTCCVCDGGQFYDQALLPSEICYLTRQHARRDVAAAFAVVVVAVVVAAAADVVAVVVVPCVCRIGVSAPRAQRRQVCREARCCHDRPHDVCELERGGGEEIPSAGRVQLQLKEAGKGQLCLANQRVHAPAGGGARIPIRQPRDA